MINMTEKEFLDMMFEGVDCNTKIEITDSNFLAIKDDILGSLGSLLANASLSIIEQKKLLQSSRTPIGLQTALKLMGVTVGNLLHASTSMLGWMGKLLNKDEAVMDAATAGDLEILIKGLQNSMNKQNKD